MKPSLEPIWYIAYGKANLTQGRLQSAYDWQHLAWQTELQKKKT